MTTTEFLELSAKLRALEERVKKLEPVNVPGPLPPVELKKVTLPIIQVPKSLPPDCIRCSKIMKKFMFGPFNDTWYNCSDCKIKFCDYDNMYEADT